MLAPSRRARNRRTYLELLRARWMALFALGALAVGAFLKLTSELTEGELEPFDRQVLGAVIALRRSALNGIAVDVTALGSVTVITLVVSCALACLAIGRHWGSICQLLVAAMGAGLASTLLKRVLERERPAQVSRLVEVASYSYPSGHSLGSACMYLTLAIVTARLLQGTRRRAGLFAFALALSATIGASRAYLGVHYPTDIAAGLLLGWGWALVLGAVFSYLRGKEQLAAD